MTEVKKLRAKNFMFQLHPDSRSLKIGFGEYFYEQKREISITEEFSQRVLHKLENLQIDDRKRIAEFDAMFKGVHTHFVIKEVYAGTLGIMKFIKSYNERPFPIRTKHEDDVGIVIDRSGFSISLSTPECARCIHLSNPKVGPYFMLRYPEPSLRLALKSCKVSEKGLQIKCDSLDQYTNRQTKRTGYRWVFDIQPELQTLVAELMKVALGDLAKC